MIMETASTIENAKSATFREKFSTYFTNLY